MCLLNVGVFTREDRHTDDMKNKQAGIAHEELKTDRKAWIFGGGEYHIYIWQIPDSEPLAGIPDPEPQAGMPDKGITALRASKELKPRGGLLLGGFWGFENKVMCFLFFSWCSKYLKQL